MNGYDEKHLKLIPRNCITLTDYFHATDKQQLVFRYKRMLTNQIKRSYVGLSQSYVTKLYQLALENSDGVCVDAGWVSEATFQKHFVESGIFQVNNCGNFQLSSDATREVVSEVIKLNSQNSLLCW